MSDNDISLLTALLIDLKADIKALNDKLDLTIKRIDVVEADCRELAVDLKELDKNMLECQADEVKNIDDLKKIMEPAVEIADNLNDAATTSTKLLKFIANNWKWLPPVLLVIAGILGIKHPQAAAVLLSIASGTPIPTVIP